MNEHQHRLGCTCFWLPFNPDVRTQTILRLDVSALSCEGQKDTVKLGCLVGKGNGATDIAGTAPSRCQSLSVKISVREEEYGPCTSISIYSLRVINLLT